MTAANPGGAPARGGRPRNDDSHGGPLPTRPVRVWIDDPNPIYRLGLVCCLRQPGFAVVGQSTRFEPEPDLADVDVLVFDLGQRDLARNLRRGGPAARLIGLVPGGGPGPYQAPDQCTVVVRCDLTPESFVACITRVAVDDRPRRQGPPPGRGRRWWRAGRRWAGWADELAGGLPGGFGTERQR